MKYGKDFFDTYIERRGTRSIKWDGCNAKFGVDEGVEMLPMWIADMDFKAPDEVVEAVAERAAHGVYGYIINRPDSFPASIARWICCRYHWQAKEEWILFTPGVIPGFNISYQTFTQPGDGIIVQTPIYYPFMDGIRNNGRKMVVNQLVETDGYYTMNFEELEQLVKDPNNKILIMANPHNPTGRCWTAEELTRLGELCADNGVLLICDEIHADIIMEGAQHCSMGTLSKKILQNTIFHYAPSKTFNLAGLQTAYVVIPNDDIRAKFEAGLTANRIFNMNWFGQVALETAYDRCGDYVEGMCRYVSANMDYMVAYIQKNLPMLKVRKSEGTYMVWVDFRGTGMTTEEIEHFIAHKAHIGVDMGTWFGPGGEGWLRFNLACPRSLVEKAMAMLTRALYSKL
ncbi:MAG: pyridoxal phosphate-dependent aminotransferase [Oscillospiraceae bacterium]|nr:pyridoxal phosphate-dependent aminotransferase [Oscillospiraceae bacterium]